MKLTLDQNLQYVAQQYLDTAVPESAPGAPRRPCWTPTPGRCSRWRRRARSTPPTRTPSIRTRRSTRRSCRRSSRARSEGDHVRRRAPGEALITPQTVDPRARLDPDGRRDDQRRVVRTRPQNFTATGVLAESSNVGTLKIAQKLGPADVVPLREGVRGRHQDRHRAAGREQRLPAAAQALVGVDVRQPAVRPGREHDGAAAGRRSTRRSPTTACASRRASCSR